MGRGRSIPEAARAVVPKGRSFGELSTSQEIFAFREHSAWGHRVRLTTSPALRTAIGGDEWRVVDEYERGGCWCSHGLG